MSAPAQWHEWREQLAARVSGDPIGDDPQLSRKAALVVVDDLAAMVFGRQHSEIRDFSEAMTRGDVHGEATVVAGGRAPRERAAAANAVAAGWDELDEGYRPATCHGGLYALPAAMAESEATGASLDELLSAVVVGYEVATAVARAFPAPRPLVLHPHATLSPIGAAAAVTWLRTRSGGAVLDAVDAAATMSMAGPFRHATSGAQVRNVWAGGGAVLGFLASDAAAAGLRGDAVTLFDIFGTTYGQDVDPGELSSDRGSWAIIDGYHKRYAACQYTHAALECALEICEGSPLESPGDVVAIDVDTHPLAMALDDRAPTTALGGKFSVPHVVAAVLATGSADAAVFASGNLTDPTVAALRERVDLTAYEPLPEPPHDRPASVTVRYVDGTQRRAECLSAVGGPDRPLGEAEVLEKAGDLTARHLPDFSRVAAQIVDGEVAGSEPWAAILSALVPEAGR
ncbi:MmgE/PrpD family protein [Dietzia sp. PP-33]|jgi:2-methylcitrate dehydratase PrpD|uniref:MmgE/PrpD family protein n=1 Tax=Dietzia sp. PP-33 TaxID=2957500 RepID=UPI0029B44651|nr:MmgE/PrpD family protein [Dietzia sp. PP-33]MDX2357252.1 MmgE/PrpD family protein [Dietzia sp. PP-33]